MNQPAFLSMRRTDLWGTPSWQVPDHIHTAILFAGSRQKAAIRVNGRAMIDYVQGALKDARNIGHIVIVCDAGPLPRWAFDADYLPGVSVVRARASTGESVLGAIEAAPQGWPFLVTTADHPLLTASIVDGFCYLAATVAGDLSAGLVRRRLLEEVHPQVRRTFLPFRDTAIAGCNLFALKNPATLSAIRFWGDAGLPALVASHLDRLTLIEAFARASQDAGAHVAPILLPWPEAAIAVDGEDDLPLVADILATRNTARISGWQRVTTL